MPVDVTARLLDYQEPTSPIVVADVRLGPEADMSHKRKPRLWGPLLSELKKAAPITEAAKMHLRVKPIKLQARAFI